MRLIAFIICSTLFFSCSFDQVTSEYSTYEQANKDGFLEKGWIPYDFIKKDMTEIYVRNNIDLNFCIFSYKTSQLPLPTKEGLIIQSEEISIHGLDIPDWWNKGILGNHRANLQINHTDVVKVVINYDKGIVYGWYENGR